MKKILHILTRDDDLARQLIQKQRNMADTTVRVINLPPEGGDYKAIVAEVFLADSVEVW